MSYRTIILLASLLFAGYPCWADEKAEQLESQLENTSGSARITTLVQLVEHYKANAPTKAITYGKQALELLQDNPQLHTQLKVLMGIGRAYDVRDEYALSLQYLQQANALAKQHQNLLYLAKSTLGIGMHHFHLKQFDEAARLLLEADRIYQKLGEAKGRVAVLLNLSLVYSESDSDRIKPLKMLLKAHQLSNQVGFVKGSAFTANNIANIYKDLGETDTAVEYALLALELKQGLNHKESLANSYNQVAGIYSDQNDEVKALEYHQKALELFIEIEDRELRGGTYILIGNLYLRQNNIAKALEQFELAQALLEPLPHYPKLIQVQLSLSQALRESNQLEEAIQHVNKAQYWADISKNDEEQADILLEKARIGVASVKLNQALQYAEQSLVLYQQDQLLPKQVASMRLISEVHEKLGNFQAAYDAQKAVSDLEKALALKQNQNQVELLKIRFETEQKEREIDLLTLEKQQKEDVIIYERRQRYFLITLVSFLLVLVFMVYKIRLDRSKYRLNLEKESAESNANLKARFLADMSHEIKTPLHGISGISQLLLGSNLTPEQRFKIENILQSTDQITQLIDRVLTYSRIEQTGINPQEHTFDLIEMLEQLQALMTPLALAKGLIFNLELAPSLARIRKGDAGLLRQVLLNLLSNAVKFTESGTVTLSLSTSVKNKLVFRVSDTGIGIAAADQQKILKPYTQANDQVQRQFGGTGLGLSISRQIIETMGGALKIESVLGQGASFSFELLIPEVDKVCSMAKPADVNDGFIKGLSILLVEDLSLNQKIAVEMLAIDKHKVVIAETLKKAKTLIETQRFDLILMDIHLPDGDGMSFTKEVKVLNPDLVFVGFTASVSQQEVVECIEAGMVDVIAKPVKLDKLRRAISNAGSVGKRRAQLKENTQQEQIQNSCILDTAQLLDLKHAVQPATFESSILNLKVMTEDFVRDLESYTEAQGQYFAKQAHQIAGVASQLGLMQLASILRDFEQGSMIERDRLAQTAQQSLASLELYLAEASI